MKFTVSEIAQMLDGIIVGDEKVTIDSAAKIEEGQPTINMNLISIPHSRLQ
jgi:UDP-3-O-[3-hydroxymyristoyl] glucosamine N-acyltransferase